MIFVSTRGRMDRMSEIPVPALVSQSNQHAVVPYTGFNDAVRRTALTRYR
jgi:hypothetical protein